MSLLVRYTAFFILFLLPFNSLAFEQFEPFVENGKYGLKNAETEKVVIAPEYDGIGWSSGDFAVYQGTIAVKRNNKWALFTVEGKLVTQAIYTVLYPFADGLLIAGKRSNTSILNQYGLINIKGRTVLRLENDQLTPYEDQLIVGKLSQGQYRYGLLTKIGKEIIPISHSAIKPVKDGLFEVKGSEGLSALFTKTGQQLSAFEFETIEAFDEGRLLVKYYNRKGLVDYMGKVIIPPIYKDIRIDRNDLRALPFKKWSSWKTNSEERDYFFDEMAPLTSNRMAVQANENLGIIDSKETYIAYFENLRLEETAHGLLAVNNGQYKGVINADGKMILPVNYDAVALLESLIIAKINRPDEQVWRLFNHKGKLLSRLRYETFEVLPNGNVKAGRHGKLGILGKDGRQINPFIYDHIGEFKNGMAVVSYLGNVGIVHESGDWVVTPYKDSLAVLDHYIFYQQGSESGLLSFEDQLLFRTQDSLSHTTKNWVISHHDQGYDVLNLKGESLLKNDYDSIYQVYDDLVCLVKDERFQLFKPSNGSSHSLPLKTEWIGEYSEDLIAARIDGQWGFVDETGNLAIANRYQAVDSFSEGLAAVKLIGKWGVIDKREQIVIQPTYDSIGHFYGGLALIKRGKQFGLINREGKAVLNIDYDQLQIFNDHILLGNENLWGLADSKGNLVRTPQFDRIEQVQPGIFRVYKNGRSGVINLRGEDLVPLAYEQILNFNGGFLAAEPSTWIKSVVR